MGSGVDVITGKRVRPPIVVRLIGEKLAELTLSQSFTNPNLDTTFV